MSIFRGPGGAEFDIDVPEDAEAREEFDAWLEANGVVPVEGEPVEKPVKKAATKRASK